MNKSMHAIAGGYQYESHKFGGKDGLSKYEMQGKLTESIFCPAPLGWSNPDSYRCSYYVLRVYHENGSVIFCWRAVELVN
jgi:hypothetical protein